MTKTIEDADNRSTFSDLFRRSIQIREPVLGRTEAEDEAYRVGHLVLFCIDTLTILATVDETDLFDSNGNRFHWGASA